MNDVAAWAARQGVSVPAIAELLQILAMPPALALDPTARSEKAIQIAIRLRAPQWGGMLWRNNNGSFIDERGVLVRFGLANDSAKLNKKVKSVDLIGFMPRLIEGIMLPVFTAIEVKAGGWTWKGDARETAQQRYVNIVKSAGGIAGFAQSVDDFDAIMRGER